MTIATSLKEFINKIQRESEENHKKAATHISEIKAAPNNTVQMPQVKNPPAPQRVQQPVIKQEKVIPPKTGGCGCWGNK